jgi:hypothetical protein
MVETLVVILLLWCLFGRRRRRGLPPTIIQNIINVHREKQDKQEEGKWRRLN